MADMRDLWNRVVKLNLGACLAPVIHGDPRKWTMKLGTVQTGPGSAEAVLAEALAIVAKKGVDACRLAPVRPKPRFVPPPPKPFIPRVAVQAIKPKAIQKKAAPSRGKGKYADWSLF